MRTDHLITPEEKLSRIQRIQENRLIRSAQIIHKNNPDTTTIGPKFNFLTDIDRDLLSHIDMVYLSAVRSVPCVSSVISLEPSFNKTFSLADVIEIDQASSIRLIHFLRLIPEFECLNVKDRFVLVKYNILQLCVLRDLLVFDRNKGIFYDDNANTAKSSDDERFAQACNSLYVLFYGYHEIQVYKSNITLIMDTLDTDALCIKILMLVLIFLKGISFNDEQLWTLCDPQSVFKAHLKYVDLLFRYLIDRYTFDVAVIKMMRITENIFRIQKNTQHFKEIIRTKAHYNEIHPLYKSLVGLS